MKMKTLIVLLALTAAAGAQYPHYMLEARVAGDTVRVCDSCATIQYNTLGRQECTAEEKEDTTIIINTKEEKK